MKLGLIARADNSGLGMQTWEFYRHMQPVRTMVVDISHLNRNKVYPERYTNNLSGMVRVVTGFPDDETVREFVNGLDVVFIAEAAYNPRLYNIAREHGVKTAVQYNWEFFDWFNNTAPVPDMFIAPSRWSYEKVDELCIQRGIKHVYLHCPVNRAALPWRKITHARNFLHVAGRSAAHDRNGTETVIQSAQHLKTDAKILVHFQGEQGLGHQTTKHYKDYLQMVLTQPSKNIKIEQIEHEDYADVYKQGDVMILPRRYGGNCLPLNEALSVGMPVIMTDISPNNQLLPKNWLVPAVKTGEFTPRTTVDIYSADPEELAAKIDHFYNMTTSAMYYENLMANSIAGEISWQTLAPKYKEEFEKLCTR